MLERPCSRKSWSSCLGRASRASCIATAANSGRAHAVLCRAVACDGLCATWRESLRDIGRVWRPMPASCTRWDFAASQAFHAGRRQQVARLAHLVGLGGRADSSGPQTLRRRCAGRWLGQRGHALDSTTVDLCLSLSTGRHFVPPRRPSSCTRCWTCVGDPGLHPHQRRQAARRERARHADIRIPPSA